MKFGVVVLDFTSNQFHIAPGSFTDSQAKIWIATWDMPGTIAFSLPNPLLSQFRRKQPFATYRRQASHSRPG